MSKAQDYFKEIDDDINSIMESIIHGDSAPPQDPISPNPDQQKAIPSPPNATVIARPEMTQSRNTNYLHRTSRSRRLHAAQQPSQPQNHPINIIASTPEPDTLPNRRSRRLNSATILTTQTPQPSPTKNSGQPPQSTPNSRYSEKQQRNSASRRSAYLEVFGVNIAHPTNPGKKPSSPRPVTYTTPPRISPTIPSTETRNTALRQPTHHNSIETQNQKSTQHTKPKINKPLTYTKRSAKVFIPTIMLGALLVYSWNPIMSMLQPSSPFSDVLSANTTFKIYYPTKLPYGYKIETDSINASGNTVAIYTASDPSGNKITISAQPKPSDLNLEPLIAEMTGTKKLNTKYGEILAGRPKENPGALMTNILIDDTWIIMSLPEKTSITDTQLIDIVNSLRS